MFADWSWNEALKVIHVVVLVAILVFNVFLYLRTRSTRIVEDLQKALADGDGELRNAIESHVRNFGGTVRDHAQRIAILETTVRHMPTHGDLIGVRGELSNLNAAIAAIGERSETTHEMVRTIQEYLLEKK